MAYNLLSSAYGNLSDFKNRDKNIIKAYSLLEKTNELEKLWINAKYARVIENNNQKRFQILKEMKKKYPQEKGAYINLGTYYWIIGDFVQAEAEYKNVLKLDPDYGSALNGLAIIYCLKGKFNLAEEFGKKHISAVPDNPDAYDTLGFIYFLMGKHDDAITQYSKSLNLNPRHYTSYFYIGYISALKENYSETIKYIDHHLSAVTSKGYIARAHTIRGFYNFWLGKIKQAESDFNTAANLYLSVGNPDGESQAALIAAWSYFYLGDFKSSREYNKKYLNIVTIVTEKFPDRTYLKYHYDLLSGLIDLRNVNFDSAKNKLVGIKSVLPGDKNMWLDYYMNWFKAEIELAEGSLDKAAAGYKIPELNTYELYYILFYSLLMRDIPARAYVKKGDLDKAIKEYEKITVFNPEDNDVRLIHPLYHYELAKLYEQKGYEGKAIDEYEKFLEIWKDADEDLPQPHDARKRLARLKEGK